MKKKNVLVLLNAFWANGAGMSGGDQMFIQVFKRIRNDLGLLWCVTNQDGRASFEKEVPRVTFKTSPHGLDQLSLMANYVMRTLFAMRCLTLRPDVIYSGSDFFPDVIPAFLLKLIHPRVRWIQCVFHIYPNWRLRPGPKVKNFIAQYMQEFSLLLARRADVVLNINQGVKNHLVAKGFSERRIIINPPGADLNYLRAIPVAPPEEGYDGIFLGRIHPTKGIFDLVEIWARVVKEIPTARMAIIGSGSTRNVAQLMDSIRENRLEKNISLLGYLENDRAFALVKASKVFLFPSHEEGFGIAIVEALACNVPVVAWRLPVYEEYFLDSIQMVDCWDIEYFAKLVMCQVKDRKQFFFQDTKKLDNFSWEYVSSVVNGTIIQN
jgi:glycosyltransferase involved in cell wall biosynthesis